jgi:hypothetical protein
MLHIPPVNQRFVIDFDMLAAEYLLQLANGLVELGPSNIRREAGHLTVARAACRQCALPKKAVL